MKKGLLSLLIILLLFGCKSEPIKVEGEKFLFGTYIKIVVYDKDKSLAEKAIEKAFEEIARIDKKLNSRSKGSLIYDINSMEYTEGIKSINIDEETKGIFEEISRVYKLSNTGFDITVSPLLEAWGFGEGKQARVPSKESLDKALNKVDYSKVSIKDNRLIIRKPVEKIDTGSFLKGYAIEQAKLIMKDMGIKSAFITSISSIETIGTKPGEVPWKIGIQDPSNPKKVLKIVNLNDKSLGVSGDYQTFVEIDGKKYHHILNTKNGYPIRDKKMVVVLSEDAFTGDLYSTAFFSMKTEDILNYVESKENLDVLIVDKESDIVMSSGFSSYVDI